MASRRSRRLVAARVFGIVGLVASLVLAVGVVLMHGWASGLVDEVFASIGGTVDRGAEIADDATGRLRERAAEIDAFIAEAAGVAASAEVPAAVAQRATAIADRYAQLRQDYVAVRARLDSAFDTIARVARFAPGLDLPTERPGVLDDLDARLAEVDDAIGQLRGEAAATVDRLVAAATSLRSATERVADLGVRVESAIAEVDARIDRAQETLDGYLQLILIVLLVLVGYIALLNLVIVLLTRRPSASSGDGPGPDAPAA